jgi:hypothetical protein
MLRIDTPEWEPLLDLAPDHVDEFMWMFAVELDDGARIQAYKHYWTREYLYLDGEGRAYLHFDGSRYEGEEPGWLLSRALGEDTPTRDWYHFVEQNDPEEIEISWARSATKHRISRARSEHVVRRCGLRFAHRSHDGPLGFDEPRLCSLEMMRRGFLSRSSRWKSARGSSTSFTQCRCGTSTLVSTSG